MTVICNFNITSGEISPVSRDTVNGSQLHASNVRIQQNAQAINQLDNRINHLDVKINKVNKDARAGIAGAAAIERRANTVKAELQRLGVTADLTSIGIGEAQQVKHCADEGGTAAEKECLRPNRRVVVKAMGKTLVADAGVREAGPIGPSPLYDDKYPYSPKITGNPYPQELPMNLR